ncbi:MAG: ABC transporter substrate-binding protein [Deltaproteobacteria bacterium]|nr:ABC transporter substrate-binding protein [Deltaproteobacteria bacterium]
MITRRSLSRRELAAGLAGLFASACDTPRRAPGEVAFWFSYGGNNRKVLLELVARFNREQSAVRVLPTFQGDYFEGLVKLRTGLFVAAVPTVTHVVGEVLPYLAEAGVLEPLDEIGDDVVADLEPSLSQRGTFDGAAPHPLWALPFNRSTPIAFFNRPLFDSLGLSPPRTWAELRDVADRARVEGDRARWGFECPVDWWFWTALVGQAGGGLVERGALTLGGEAGVRALELWQRMVHEDRTMRPPPGRDFNAWEASNGDFLAGRAAMIWTSTAFVRYLEDNASFAVGAAPLPGDVRRAVPTGGTFFVMPRGLPPAEREAGRAFLRWMMAPAQASEWARRTGYMPVTTRARGELEASGFFREHPNFRVAVDQLEVAQRWPWSASLFRTQREAVQPRLEAAVARKEDARAVLAAARAASEAP